MPVIPTFEQTERPSATRLSPAAAGAPYEAISRAAEQVGGTAEQFALKYENAKRKADASEAISGATKSLADMEMRWSSVSDRQEARAGFDKEASDYRKQLLGGISDAETRLAVQTAYDDQALTRGLQAQSKAFTNESSLRQANLLQNLSDYSTAAATADSDLLRNQITEQAFNSVAAAVEGGWISPEEGQKKLMTFQSDVAETQARRDIREDPDIAVELLSDATAYPGLVPERREILLTRAQERSDQEMRRRIADVEHADRMADRRLREAQATNTAALIANVADGAGMPDTHELSELVRNQEISVEGYNAVLAEDRRQNEGTNDYAVLLPLQARVSSGEATTDEIWAAVADDKITGQKGVELVQTLLTRQKEGDNVVERAAHNQLKVALKGNAIDQGFMSLDDETQRTSVALWAAAEGEWNQRVIIGKEDPNVVVRDMLPRYQNQFVTPPESWATPAMGVVMSVADVKEIFAATKVAHDTKQMSDNEFEAQKVLLTRYLDFFERIGQRTTPADAGKPKVKTKAGGLE